MSLQSVVGAYKVWRGLMSILVDILGSGTQMAKLVDIAGTPSKESL